MLEENNKMVHEITELVNEVKYNLSKEINNKIVYVYWNIGRTYFFKIRICLIKDSHIFKISVRITFT